MLRVGSYRNWLGPAQDSVHWQTLPTACVHHPPLSQGIHHFPLSEYPGPVASYRSPSAIVVPDVPRTFKMAVKFLIPWVQPDFLGSSRFPADPGRARLCGDRQLNPLLGIPSGGFHSETGPPTAQIAPKRSWLHPPAAASLMWVESRGGGPEAGFGGKGHGESFLFSFPP
jgi:hypothetical protein